MNGTTLSLQLTTGKWYVEDHAKDKGAKGMKAVIEYDGSKEMKDKANEKKNFQN